LSKISGIEFQKIDDNCRSTFKDFAILINEEAFGLNRDALASALDEENIQTRKYFYPPVHLQKAYRHFYPIYDENLPNTLNISNNILCLPIFVDMKEEDLDKVCEAICRIQQYSDEIKERFID
jgi:dTDP-4-amino-4,6-dideoxygalactose transaminase